MAKLWFQNSEGQEREITDCANWTEVNDAINDFIDTCNENKPADQRFISYYRRTWQEGGRTKIDVGSWSEFFYWDNQITDVTVKENGEGEFGYEQ